MLWKLEEYFRNNKLEFAMYFLFAMRFCTLQMMTWDFGGWNLLLLHCYIPCVGRHSVPLHATLLQPLCWWAECTVTILQKSQPDAWRRKCHQKLYIGPPATCFDTGQVSHCTWPDVDILGIKFSSPLSLSLKTLFPAVVTIGTCCYAMKYASFWLELSFPRGVD